MLHPYCEILAVDQLNAQILVS